MLCQMATYLTLETSGVCGGGRVPCSRAEPCNTGPHPWHLPSLTFPLAGSPLLSHPITGTCGLGSHALRGTEKVGLGQEKKQRGDLSPSAWPACCRLRASPPWTSWALTAGQLRSVVQLEAESQARLFSQILAQSSRQTSKRVITGPVSTVNEQLLGSPQHQVFPQGSVSPVWPMDRGGEFTLCLPQSLALTLPATWLHSWASLFLDWQNETM